MAPCNLIASVGPVGPTGPTRTVTFCETHGVELGLGSIDGLCPVGKVEKAVEDGIARMAELSITALSLEPGDVLVVKTGDDRGYARTLPWNRILPPGVRVLIIPHEVDLSVLTKAEIEARIG